MLSKADSFDMDVSRGKAQTYAFFSSAYGGIVTDPSLMTVPVDDHAFHRGMIRGHGG